MKPYYILFIFLLLSACKTTPNTTHKEEKNSSVEHKEPVQLYGYNFILPEGFVKIIDDVQNADLKGNIRSRETAFKDSNSGVKFHVIWHPAPYGKTLYDYYHSLLSENKASLTGIAGLPAVHYTEELSTDGKGHALEVPYVRDKYFVLDNENACLELVSERQKNDKTAHNAFQQLIKNISK